MKRLLFLLALIPCLLPAQDIYSDMLAEGKTWKFIRWPSGNTHQKGMRGDTIVNGLTCKKYGYVNGDGTFGCTSIFRQDGDKIYSLNFNTGEFYLTCDFGAKMGDVITIGLARIEVTGTDVITARDHELRRISFNVIEEYDDNGWTEIQGNYGGSWIEGIGGSTGPESQIPTPGLTGNYDMMLDIMSYFAILIYSKDNTMRRCCFRTCLSGLTLSKRGTRVKGSGESPWNVTP